MIGNLEKKFYENVIKKGEVEKGYIVDYEPQRHISFKFRELNNHMIIEQNGKAIMIKDCLDDEKIKKICYKKMFEYLEKNTHVKYNMILDNSVTVLKRKGNITFLDGLPEELMISVMHKPFLLFPNNI